MAGALDNMCLAIIDDDESFCRSSCRMLRATGFQSIAYPSAEEFLADPVHTRFDCLLVDIQLGGMSGLELQRKLLADGRRTPIIFVTASEDAAARAEAMQRGCAAFFRKTEEVARLLEALGKILLPESHSRQSGDS